MTDFDDIRDRLEDVETKVQAGPGAVVVVSEADGYPSAAGFEDRYGHPPDDADSVVITVPEEAEDY